MAIRVVRCSALIAVLVCAAAPAAFAQQAATPRGDPESWLQTPDYAAAPSDAHGSIAILLSMDQTGRTFACQVEESSGSAAFDADICAKLRRRSRFMPALDTERKPVAGNWRHRYRWAPAG